MAKTLKQIEAQIAKLQREAETVKAKEMVGVVARIQEAIVHYGLTAADLFGAKAGRGAAHKTKKNLRKKAGKKATAGVIRFRDDAGNTWTGHGRSPNWFKSALESGKTREELAVRA